MKYFIKYRIISTITLNVRSVFLFLYVISMQIRILLAKHNIGTQYYST